MAPLLKQSKPFNSAGLGDGGNGYVPSRVVTVDSNVASGSLLFLALNVTGAGASISTITDTRVNTWSRWGAPINHPDTDNDCHTEIWTAVSNGAGANTITITAAVAVAWAGVFEEWTGLTSTPRGTFKTFAESPNYDQSHSITSTDPINDGDVVIAVLNISLGGATISAGNGYSNLITSSAPTGLPYISAAVESRIASATGVQAAGFSTQQYTKGVLALVSLKPLVTSAPPSPTDLNASPGDRSAALSAARSPGAVSYTFRRATVSTGPYTVVASALADPVFTDTLLTNGTKYYYSISAVNSVGESTPTAFSPVTPAVPPAATFHNWFESGFKPNLDPGPMRFTWITKFKAWLSYVLTDELTPGLKIPQNPRLPGPIKRIKAPDQSFYSSIVPFDTWYWKRNGTVSEGLGFAGINYAWASNPQLEANVYWPDAKAGAESIYRFYDQHKNERGLAHWHQFDTGQDADFNGATDGDFDILEMCVLMSVLHGDAGTINWGAEADRLMKAIEDYEFVPESGYAFPNLMLCGDGWGINNNIYMADYARFAYFMHWEKWLRARGKTARADRWLRIIDTNLDFIQHYMDSPQWSAGVPDRQTRQYTQIEKPDNDFVTYNSVRLGFGQMLAHLWWGNEADPRMLAYMNKISNRAKEVFGTGTNVKALRYSGNLSQHEGYSNATGYAYIGSLSLGQSANQTFATEIFNALAASGDYTSNYFNGGMGVYALAVMSGAAQPFGVGALPSGEEPPPVDPGDDPVPPAPLVRDIEWFYFAGKDQAGNDQWVATRSPASPV